MQLLPMQLESQRGVTEMDQQVCHSSIGNQMRPKFTVC